MIISLKHPEYLIWYGPNDNLSLSNIKVEGMGQHDIRSYSVTLKKEFIEEDGRDREKYIVEFKFSQTDPNDLPWAKEFINYIPVEDNFSREKIFEVLEDAIKYSSEELTRITGISLVNSTHYQCPDPQFFKVIGDDTNHHTICITFDISQLSNFEYIISDSEYERFHRIPFRDIKEGITNYYFSHRKEINLNHK